MKPEKKKALQLAVLGVLVVSCVGYLSFSYVAPKQSEKAAVEKSAKKAAEPESGPGAEPEAVVSLAPQAWNVFPDLSSLPARRDPFVSQALPGENLQTAARPPIHMPKLLSNAGKSMISVPPINVGPMNPFGGQSAASVQRPPEEKTDPEDAISVTGVVRGASNVAILRIGQSGRHVVKEGQTIDGRYYVASVTGDGVVLVYKNRHIPVKLGGVKNAK
jgi:hypothetical protein